MAGATGLLIHWNPDLHPRDRRGRFRNGWKLSERAKKLLEQVTQHFSPTTASSDQEMGAKLRRFQRPHTPAQAKAVHHFYTRRGNIDVQSALRSNADESKPGFPPQIHDMRSAEQPLPADMILTRVTGPDAFGLPAERIDEVEEWTGKLVSDPGFFPTNAGTSIPVSGPHVTWSILAPRGTPAIIQGGGNNGVVLTEHQPLRIVKVERRPDGGSYVYAAVMPKVSGGREGSHALGHELPESHKSPAIEATPEEMARRNLTPEGQPIPQPLPPSGTPAPGEEGLQPHTPVRGIQPAPPPKSATQQLQEEGKAQAPVGAGHVTQPGEEAAPRPKLGREGPAKAVTTPEGAQQTREAVRLRQQQERLDKEQQRIDVQHEQIQKQQADLIEMQQRQIEALTKQEGAPERPTITRPSSEGGTKATGLTEEQKNSVLGRVYKGVPRTEEDVRQQRLANQIMEERGQPAMFPNVEEHAAALGAPAPAKKVARASRAVKKAVAETPSERAARAEQAVATEEKRIAEGKPRARAAKKAVPETPAPEAPAAEKKAVRAVKKAAPEAPAPAPEAPAPVEKKAVRAVKKAAPEITPQAPAPEAPPAEKKAVRAVKKAAPEGVPEAPAAPEKAAPEAAKKAVPREAPPARTPEEERANMERLRQETLARNRAQENERRKAAGLTPRSEEDHRVLDRARELRREGMPEEQLSQKDRDILQKARDIKERDQAEQRARIEEHLGAPAAPEKAAGRKQAPPGSMERLLEETRPPEAKPGLRRQMTNDEREEVTKEAQRIQERGGPITTEEDHIVARAKGLRDYEQQVAERERARLRERAAKVSPEEQRRREKEKAFLEGKMPKNLQESANRMDGIADLLKQEGASDQDSSTLRRAGERLRRGEPVAHIKEDLQSRADFLRHKSEVNDEEVNPGGGERYARQADLYDGAIKAIGRRGPAAGKISAADLGTGDRVLVSQNADGKWIPSTKKTGATPITVTRIETLGTGKTQRLVVHGRDAQGHEVEVHAARGKPGMTAAQRFFVHEEKKPAAKKVLAEGEIPNTLAERRAMAKDRKIPGYSRMNKEELGTALHEHMRREKAGELPQEETKPKVTRATKKVAEKAVPEKAAPAKRVVKKAAEKAAPVKPVTVKRAAKKTTEAAVPQTVDEHAAHIKGMHNEDEIAKYLNDSKLTIPQMKEVAAQVAPSLSTRGRMSRAQLAQNIAASHPNVLEKRPATVFREPAAVKKAARAVKKAAPERPTIKRAAAKKAAPEVEAMVGQRQARRGIKKLAEKLRERHEAAPRKRGEVSAAPPSARAAKKAVPEAAPEAKPRVSRAAKKAAPEEGPKLQIVPTAKKAPAAARVKQQAREEIAQEQTKRLTLKELQAKAGTMGIPGRSRMKREDLEKAVAGRESLPDTIDVATLRKQLDPSVKRLYKNISPEDARKAVRSQGLTPRGTTGPEIIENSFKDTIERHVAELKGKPVVKRAAKVPEESVGGVRKRVAKATKEEFGPGGAKHIDASKLAEGLDRSHFEHGQGDHLTDVQARLDQGDTPGAIAKDVRRAADGVMTRAVYMHGGWQQDRGLTGVDLKDLPADLKAWREKGIVSDKREFAKQEAKAKTLREFADRLEKTRRPIVRKAAVKKAEPEKPTISRTAKKVAEKAIPAPKATAAAKKAVPEEHKGPLDERPDIKAVLDRIPEGDRHSLIRTLRGEERGQSKTRPSIAATLRRQAGFTRENGDSAFRTNPTMAGVLERKQRADALAEHYDRLADLVYPKPGTKPSFRKKLPEVHDTLEHEIHAALPKTAYTDHAAYRAIHDAIHGPHHQPGNDNYNGNSLRRRAVELRFKAEQLHTEGLHQSKSKIPGERKIGQAKVAGAKDAHKVADILDARADRFPGTPSRPTITREAAKKPYEDAMKALHEPTPEVKAPRTRATRAAKKAAEAVPEAPKVTRPRATRGAKKAAPEAPELSREQLNAIGEVHDLGRRGQVTQTPRWVDQGEVSEAHRKHLDYLAEHGILQRHVGPHGEKMYRIDPRGFYGRQPPTKSGALEGDIIKKPLEAEHRLPTHKINRGAILHVYPDGKGGFSPHPQHEGQKPTRISVIRTENLDSEGNPTRAVIAPQQHVVGRDLETGKRLDSGPRPPGTSYEWEMNPEGNEGDKGIIEGELAPEKTAAKAIKAAAPSTPEEKRAHLKTFNKHARTSGADRTSFHESSAIRDRARRRWERGDDPKDIAADIRRETSALRRQSPDELTPTDRLDHSHDDLVDMRHADVSSLRRFADAIGGPRTAEAAPGIGAGEPIRLSPAGNLVQLRRQAIGGHAPDVSGLNNKELTDLHDLIRTTPSSKRHSADASIASAIEKKLGSERPSKAGPGAIRKALAEKKLVPAAKKAVPEAKPAAEKPKLLKDLQEEARVAGIPGRARMNKGQLTEALRAHHEGGGKAPERPTITRKAATAVKKAAPEAPAKKTTARAVKKAAPEVAPEERKIGQKAERGDLVVHEKTTSTSYQGGRPTERKQQFEVGRVTKVDRQGRVTEYQPARGGAPVKVDQSKPTSDRYHLLSKRAIHVDQAMETARENPWPTSDRKGKPYDSIKEVQDALRPHRTGVHVRPEKSQELMHPRPGSVHAIAQKHGINMSSREDRKLVDYLQEKLDGKSTIFKGKDIGHALTPRQVADEAEDIVNDPHTGLTVQRADVRRRGDTEGAAEITRRMERFRALARAIRTEHPPTTKKAAPPVAKKTVAEAEKAAPAEKPKLLKDLQEEARVAGIPGRSRMTKAQLTEALRKHHEGGGEAPGRPTITRTAEKKAATVAKKAAPEAPAVKKTATRAVKKAAPEAPAVKKAAPVSKIDEHVPLKYNPEGDNMRMHGDSLTMGVAQDYAKGGRNGSANRLMELRRRATTEGDDKLTPQQVVDELKKIRADEHDPVFQRKLDHAIEGIDSPKTPMPELPHNTPPLARKLMEDLHSIPYARKGEGDFGGGGHISGPSLVDRLAQVYRDAAAGRRDENGRRPEDRIRSILREHTHEINEASFPIWRLSHQLESKNGKPSDLSRELRDWEGGKLTPTAVKEELPGAAGLRGALHKANINIPEEGSREPGAMILHKALRTDENDPAAVRAAAEGMDRGAKALRDHAGMTMANAHTPGQKKRAEDQLRAATSLEHAAKAFRSHADGLPGGKKETPSAPEAPVKKAARAVKKAAPEAPKAGSEPTITDLAKEAGITGDGGGLIPARELDLKQGHSRAEVADRIRRDADRLEKSPLDQNSSDPGVNAAARRDRADAVAKIRDWADRVEGKKTEGAGPTITREAEKAAPEHLKAEHWQPGEGIPTSTLLAARNKLGEGHPSQDLHKMDGAMRNADRHDQVPGLYHKVDQQLARAGVGENERPRKELRDWYHRTFPSGEKHLAGQEEHRQAEEKKAAERLAGMPMTRAERAARQAKQDEGKALRARNREKNDRIEHAAGAAELGGQLEEIAQRGKGQDPAEFQRIVRQRLESPTGFEGKKGEGYEDLRRAMGDPGQYDTPEKLQRMLHANLKDRGITMGDEEGTRVKFRTGVHENLSGKEIKEHTPVEIHRPGFIYEDKETGGHAITLTNPVVRRLRTRGEVHAAGPVVHHPGAPAEAATREARKVARPGRGFNDVRLPAAGSHAPDHGIDLLREFKARPTMRSPQGINRADALTREMQTHELHSMAEAMGIQGHEKIGSQAIRARVMRELRDRAGVPHPFGQKQRDELEQLKVEDLRKRLPAGARVPSRASKSQLIDAIVGEGPTPQAHVTKSPEVRRLERSVKSGAAAPKRSLGTGETGQVDLMEDKSGKQLVRKRIADRWFMSGRQQADAEQLKSELGVRSGAPVPAVYRGADRTVYMDHVSGKLASRHSAEEIDAAVRSPEGRHLAMLDAITGEPDRHNNNWKIVDGKPVGIDNAASWDQFSHTLGPRHSRDGEILPGLGTTNDPFAAHYKYRTMDVDPESGLVTGGKWTSKNGFYQDELKDVRKQLVAMKPQFDRLHRRDWYEQSLARTDALIKRARPGRGPVEEPHVPAAEKKVAKRTTRIAEKATPSTRAVKKAEPRKVAVPEKRAAAKEEKVAKKVTAPVKKAAPERPVVKRAPKAVPEKTAPRPVPHKKAPVPKTRPAVQRPVAVKRATPAKTAKPMEAQAHHEAPLKYHRAPTLRERLQSKLQGKLEERRFKKELSRRSLSGRIAEGEDLGDALKHDTPPEGLHVRDLTVPVGGGQAYTVREGTIHRHNGITYLIEHDHNKFDPKDDAQKIYEQLRAHQASLPRDAKAYQRTYAVYRQENPMDPEFIRRGGFDHSWYSVGSAWDGHTQMWQWNRQSSEQGHEIPHILDHEFGHNVDHQVPEELSSRSVNWEVAAMRDREPRLRVRSFTSSSHAVPGTQPLGKDYPDAPFPHPVTGYGSSNAGEDYGDSVRMYLAGKLGTGRLVSSGSDRKVPVYFRDLFPERAAILDKVFPGVARQQQAEIEKVRPSAHAPSTRLRPTAPRTPQVARPVIHRAGRGGRVSASPGGGHGHSHAGVTEHSAVTHEHAYDARSHAISELAHRPTVGKPTVLSQEGNSSHVELQDKGDGRLLVHKNYNQDWRTKGNKQRQIDAEDLGTQAVHAIGLDVAATHPGKEPGTLDVEFVHGRHVPSSSFIASSDQGKLYGLSVFLTGNDDANDGNWMLGDRGRFVSFDHAGAFSALADTEHDLHAVPTTNYFLHHLAGRGPTLADKVDWNPADLAIIRTRLEALKPKFQNAGRIGWWDKMMARLKLVEERADPGAKRRL